MFRQYRRPDKGENVIVACDPAVGGSDYCAAHFFSRQRLDVFMVYHSRVIGTEMTNIIYPVLEKLNEITQIKPIVGYERNNGGAFEMERLAALNRLGKFELFKMPNLGRIDAPEAVRYGWETNSATRSAMLGHLKEAIDKRLIGIYDKETVNELYSFVVSQTSSSWKAQAESGAHDDLVMALSGAWFIYQNTQLKKIPTMNIPPKPYHPNDSIIGIWSNLLPN